MEHSFNKRYVGRFVGITLVLFIISSFLPIPGIFNLLLSGGAAFYVGMLFVKDHNRMPEMVEHNRFAVRGFAGLMAITCTLTVLMFSVMEGPDKDAFLTQFREASWGVIIVGTLLALLMLWGSVHTGFGIGARKKMKSLEPEKTA